MLSSSKILLRHLAQFVELSGLENIIVAFPLTPALSLGERENRRLSLGCSNAIELSPQSDRSVELPNAGAAIGVFETIKRGEMRFPLPEGEGKGEGEQDIRVRRGAQLLSCARTNDGLSAVKFAGRMPALPGHRCSRPA